MAPTRVHMAQGRVRTSRPDRRCQPMLATRPLQSSPRIDGSGWRGDTAATKSAEGDHCYTYAALIAVSRPRKSNNGSPGASGGDVSFAIIRPRDARADRDTYRDVDAGLLSRYTAAVTMTAPE
jgi:hypothetical protein